MNGRPNATKPDAGFVTGRDNQAEPVSGCNPCVVFCYFHASMGDTFRSPVLFAGCSGDLKSAGRQTRVVEVYLDHDNPSHSLEIQAELARHLRQLNPKVIVLQEVPDEGLFGLIRGAVSGSVVLADAYSRFDAGTVDVVVSHFVTRPGILTRVVERLLDGEPIDDLPNVEDVSKFGSARARREEPQGPIPLFDALPDYERTIIPQGYTPVSDRLSVLVNPGCPYRASASMNPFFAGIDLSDPSIATLGCSFCHVGGDYQALSPARSVARILDEIDNWKTVHPDVEEVVLWDESPYRYMDLLVRGLVDRDIQPITVCFHARPDDLVRFAGRLESACRASEVTGGRVGLSVVLIGFESFAEAALERLNKGVSPAVLESAIVTCRRLANDHPTVFSYDRYRASSFVLFTPWTTVEDLRDEVTAFERVDILEFSTGMGLTKLRLYPNLPLFHKAKADALLDDDFIDESLNAAARFGYSREYPWRFADPIVGDIYSLYSRLYSLVDRRDQVALLSWTINRMVAGFDGHFDSVVAQFRRLKALNETVERGVSDNRDPMGFEDEPGARVGGSTIELSMGPTCNNGCNPCERDVAVFEPSPGLLAVRLGQMVSNGRRRLVVMGREPTLSPRFLDAVRLARSAGFKSVDVLTNGRMFAYPSFTQKAIEAGVDVVRIKVFGGDQERWTRITRDPRAYRDTIIGMSNLINAKAQLSIRAVIIVSEESLDDIESMAKLVRRLGVDQISLRITPTNLPIRELGQFVATLDKQLTQAGLIQVAR